MSSRERRNKLAKCVERGMLRDRFRSFFHDTLRYNIALRHVLPTGRIDESKSWSYIAAEFATRRGLNCKLAGNRYYLGRSPISNWEDRVDGDSFEKPPTGQFDKMDSICGTRTCICRRKLQKLMRQSTSEKHFVHKKKKERKVSEKKVKVLFSFKG